MLVTGAGSGLGRAAAGLLATEPDRHVVLVDLAPDGARVAGELGGDVRPGATVRLAGASRMAPM